MKDLKAIEKKTKDIYEANAVAFDKQRDKKLFEKEWLDKFLSKLEQNDDILDIGCGSGEPITKYLITNNFNVTGVDFSQNLITIAQQKFPNNLWLVQDMRNLNLNKKFKGIIAWNSFFHLTNEDQIKTLGHFGDYLLPGGVLLFTAGPEKGEITGHINGHEVYHSSLSIDEYKDELTKLNIELIEYKLNDPSCNFHSVFLARKDKGRE